MPRLEAEQLLAAKLILAKAVSADEIWAYYELDPAYMVCVTYDRRSRVLRSPSLIPNSVDARKNLAEWASK
jgi:hypothetical protein